MQLLVSVRDAREAAAALAGGADIVDAKEPASGALGAVSIDTFCAIVRTVDRRRILSAAVGDAIDEQSVERDASAFARAGAALVKVGFAAVADHRRLCALLEAAVRGAGASRLIAVAYADYDRVGSVPPTGVIEAAKDSGAAGILIDTADKTGAPLRDLAPQSLLEQWIEVAHRANLSIALAGKLTADDLGPLQRVGADIAGVRGAACNGDRNGRVTADRVRLLTERIDAHHLRRLGLVV